MSRGATATDLEPMSMTRAQAEADASALLDSTWWRDGARTQPLPVDPFELARGLGIFVRLERLPADESGRINIRHDGDVVITVNMYDHPNRQRFTVAHEIGHYVDHQRRGLIGSRDFTDYRSTLAGMGVDPDEIYANQFAAALLMPEHLMTGSAGRGQDSRTLARRFGTSEGAFEVRLRNLGIAP